MPIPRQGRELTLCGACELGEKRVSVERRRYSRSPLRCSFTFSRSESSTHASFPRGRADGAAWGAGDRQPRRQLESTLTGVVLSFLRDLELAFRPP